MTTFEGYAVRTPEDLAEAAGEKVFNSWGHNNRVCETAKSANIRREYASRIGDVYAVKLTLPEGGYFQVNGDITPLERGGKPFGPSHFLDYWMADRATRRKGAQGSDGWLSVMIPRQQEIKVIDADGQERLLDTVTTYVSQPLQNYVEFLGEPIQGLPKPR